MAKTKLVKPKEDGYIDIVEVNNGYHPKQVKRILRPQGLPLIR
jgi:hypothetical protein